MDDDTPTTADEQAIDAEAQAAADTVSQQRLWEDEVATGPAVPFDPEKFEPKLTPEELKALEEEE